MAGFRYAVFEYVPRAGDGDGRWKRHQCHTLEEAAVVRERLGPDASTMTVEVLEES